MAIRTRNEMANAGHWAVQCRRKSASILAIGAAATVLSSCSSADRLEDVIDFWAQTPAHCLERSGVELNTVSLIVWRNGQPRHSETPVTYKEEMKTDEIFAFSVINAQEERVGLFTHFQSRPDDLIWAEPDVVLTRCK